MKFRFPCNDVAPKSKAAYSAYEHGQYAAQYATFDLGAASL